MKPRRELKVGEKVRFEDNDGTILVGKVEKTSQKRIYIARVEGIEEDVWFHRRQVLATFRKKAKSLKLTPENLAHIHKRLEESQFNKPVYQWAYLIPNCWIVHPYLLTKEQAAEDFNDCHYRIHSGPFEGEAP